jgi:hypothetical protein
MIFLFYFVAVFITLHYNHMYIHQIIIELQLQLQIYYIIITRIYLCCLCYFLLMIVRCISWSMIYFMIIMMMFWDFDPIHDIIASVSLPTNTTTTLFSKTTDTTSPSSFVFEPLSSITTKNCIRFVYFI